MLQHGFAQLPRLSARVFAMLACVVVAAGASCDPTQADQARGTRTDCVQCHQADYEGARRHVDEKPTTCGVCHSETSWHRTKIEHEWPLTGKHAKARCFACHSGAPAHYKDTSTECVSCHAEDADPPPFPDHKDFGDDCGSCHTTENWKSAKRKRRGASDGLSPTTTSTPTAPSATVTPGG